MQDRYIRAAELIRMTGLSPSTIWRLEQEGEFPRRRKIGSSAIGWLESEIDDWLKTREPVSEGATK